MQGSFYPANWLNLANFDSNFVIPEISVNQVRKDLACMLGGSGRLFMTVCLALIYFAHLAEFSLGYNDPCRCYIMIKIEYETSHTSILFVLINHVTYFSPSCRGR